MPRIYITPAELLETPLGIGLSSDFSSLGNGVLDKLISRASVMCDDYCNKRIQAPGSTTLAQNASVGASTISVASTLTLDDKDEQMVIIGTGSTQESIIIATGGVLVSSWVSPYPGTITLLTPLLYNHIAGDPVQFVYQEVTQAQGSSTSDPYTESLETQTMQLALAHLPPAHTSLTRVVMLKAYPILNILNIEHAFSFVNEFHPVSLEIESTVPSEGWIRFNVGTVILREGLMRMTYTAGYQQVPEPVKTACSYYVALQMMQMVNPYFADSVAMGKRSVRYDMSKGKANVAVEAENWLKNYKRTV